MERDDALPRLLDHLLAELDGLGQDDLLLGGQQGDLADLLEVHPDRVVDADHVGREGLELLPGRLLDLLRVELGRGIRRQRRRRLRPPSSTTSTPTSSPARRPAPRRRASVSSASKSSSSVVLVLVRSGDGGTGARRTHDGELRLLEIGLGAPGRATGRLRRAACRGDRPWMVPSAMPVRGGQDGARQRPRRRAWRGGGSRRGVGRASAVVR